MEIIGERTSNQEIDLITLFGQVAGSGAIELQDYLYRCLDNSRCNILMNLEHVERIDGLGIKIICDLVTRGMHIGLFNVGAEVRMMFRMDKKENVVSIYNEPCLEKVLKIFVQDVLMCNNKRTRRIRNRSCPRFSSDIPVEFKCNYGQIGEVLFKANILNFSETGIFMGHIVYVNPRIDEVLADQKMNGTELYEIKFKLGDSSFVAESKGVCVRELIYDGNTSAGIRFKYLSKFNRNKIKEYINTLKCNTSRHRN